MTFIDEHADRRDGGLRWGVERICRVLSEQGLPIAPATYYAAKTRPPSPRFVRDGQLKPRIAELHAENYGVCRELRRLPRTTASTESARCTPRCAATASSSDGTRSGG